MFFEFISFPFFLSNIKGYQDSWLVAMPLLNHTFILICPCQALFFTRFIQNKVHVTQMKTDYHLFNDTICSSTSKVNVKAIYLFLSLSPELALVLQAQPKSSGTMQRSCMTLRFTLTRGTG